MDGLVNDDDIDQSDLESSQKDESWHDCTNSESSQESVVPIEDHEFEEKYDGKVNRIPIPYYSITRIYKSSGRYAQS
ncbi:unnamed protein product [Lactuca virosa]|uniref:Uncharacterized protein n=1 Tax=Lactuca virosa TaxID=75947 RepID=A0AAU9NSE8_9ASTR|nr:unnamed protein product [Lactuca virosa]